MNAKKSLMFYFAVSIAVFLLFCLWYANSRENYASYLAEREQIVFEAEAAAEEAQKELKININTATAQELIALPHIGEKTAAKIIAYREEVGGFSDTSEIMNVSGIGENIYNDIKGNIVVR